MVRKATITNHQSDYPEIGNKACLNSTRLDELPYAQDLAPPSPEEVVGEPHPKESDDEPSDHLTQTGPDGSPLPNSRHPIASVGEKTS